MASERIQRQIDRLLDQAEEAMGRLEWGTVRECARVVLGLDSTNSDALAFLAPLPPTCLYDRLARYISDPLDVREHGLLPQIQTARTPRRGDTNSPPRRSPA